MTVRTRLAAAWLAVLPAAAAAQTPPPRLVVVLRDPSGQPVARAHGELLCGPDHELVALRGMRPDPRTTLASTTVLGTSDEHGVLRFETRGDARAGAGLVTTAEGLGCLVERLRPGAAQRLGLQPLAELTTSTGTEQFTLWARAITGDGSFVPLPPSRGTSARLPAGTYEVWAASDDGWTWQRLQLLSGRPARLEFGGPPQRVRARAGAGIRPASWPAIDLVGPTGEFTLRGSALAAALTAELPAEGLVVCSRVLPLPPGPDVVVWPPPLAAEPVDYGIAVGQGLDAPAAGEAQLFAAEPTDAGDWRVLGASLLGPDGRFRLPPLPDGDVWLLLVARGHAAQAVPRSRLLPGRNVPLARGLPLVVVATTTGGDPAVDAVIDYSPIDGDAATLQARTDGRGVARFGLVTAPGTVRISDPRFVNQDLTLDAPPRDGLRVTVSAGESIAGAVVLDGSDGPGVLVTLRDPTGRLRPAARTVVAGPGGAFAFSGLPAGREFVVSAATTREGRTWSGQRTARAGSDGVEVTVRCEDPELRPDRR